MQLVERENLGLMRSELPGGVELWPLFFGDRCQNSLLPQGEKKTWVPPSRARRRGLQRPREWRRGRAAGHRQLARQDAELPASLGRTGSRVFALGSAAGSSRAQGAAYGVPGARQAHGGGQSGRGADPDPAGWRRRARARRQTPCAPPSTHAQGRARAPREGRAW